MALSREDDALLRYERALELNASHLPTLEAVGPMYMARSEHKKGQATWRQILQLTGGHGDPERAAHYYTQLGLVEHALGNAEKASKRFSKALEINEHYIGALKGMGAVLEDRKDWHNLLTFFNKVIQHAKDHDDLVDAYLTKGRVLDQHLGRPDKALEHYEQLIMWGDNNPRARLRLAELMLREDKLDVAASHTDEGMRNSGGGAIHATLAMLHAAILMRQEKTDEAESFLGIARSSDQSLDDDLAAPDAPALVSLVVQRMNELHR